MAKKLWQVATIQGHHNPFLPDLLALNEAQLDFILEMWAVDNPKRGRFVREGKSPGMTEAKARARWADVLRGPALAAYLAQHMPSQAVLQRLRNAGTRRVRPMVRQPAKPPVPPKPPLKKV
jgi:hypothetical protein